VNQPPNNQPDAALLLAKENESIKLVIRQFGAGNPNVTAARKMGETLSDDERSCLTIAWKFKRVSGS
jgi:hypothetical protein